MQVYKFGGASVKSAEAIKKIPAILQQANHKLCIVVSAMDKTTNNLELLVELYFHQKPGLVTHLKVIKAFHFSIVNELFKSDLNAVKRIEEIFDELESRINIAPSGNFDFEYDQIVSYGEILSTSIISLYLKASGINTFWLDAREILITNKKHRDATVNFSISLNEIEARKSIFDSNIVVTQGFIGKSEDGSTTTLGREGSDYSGSVLAYLLNAESLTVWKDVEGILTADPTWKSNTIKLDTISYKEAIELAFFGAKVIHPKTIKPLQNKQIPLYVKSFLNPNLEGTIIGSTESISPLNPVFIRKQNQVLLSIIPKDFSFVAEDNFSEIFSVIAECNIKVNLMQNSAVSFSLCVDYDQRKFQAAVMKLKHNFNIRYNLNLELITIRHYNTDAINEIIGERKVILEQRSRNTIQFIID